MKKISILFNIPNGNKWIGGIYYLKNIMFILSQNVSISKKVNIIIRVDDNIKVFDCLNKLDFIKIINVKHKSRFRDIAELCRTIFSYKIKYIYNVSVRNKIIFYKLLGVMPIAWIPDFQHNYYKNFFSEEEVKTRTEQYSQIQKSNVPLVLSSNACKSDFIKFYGDRSGIYVVPFVSYIEPELEELDDEAEEATLQKYDIRRGGYACISNQFWQHKNHIVILKAIKRRHYDLGNFKFVFTGYPKDYRNPEYYNLLIKYMEDPEVKPHIKVLGFVERIEQLTIMKNSKFIIQPSLFEGWGTVVEDAKVLDKDILLSDIPVHREQMNE